MYKVGIIGVTGYAGLELFRLLKTHPFIKINKISSESFKGIPLSQVYPNLKDISDMICESSEEVIKNCDVIFAALPAGLCEDFAKTCYEQDKLFIDLGADFRLEDEEDYKQWYGGTYKNKDIHKKAVYGLPELFREEIKGKKLIANPGCYTTATELALSPALKNNLIDTRFIVADCKSGATGAGRKLSDTTHFAKLNEGCSAYKVGVHRHIPEIEQVLSKVANSDITVTFVPHLLSVNRGILASCYAKLNDNVTKEDVLSAYHKFYDDEYFVRLYDDGRCVDIHDVKYSNYCDISVHIDERTRTLVVISAIDNMVKGSAGQAIQNMNIALGFCENTALQMIPPAF
ncbi:MAG: N-acetyl-gamma-glutamyl-phosphate reductase [Clostridia bacterium]|nr:N-acetyl-gamma-glutamyl-phosphate reductase [Clostridia bacterium]